MSNRDWATLDRAYHNEICAEYDAVVDEPRTLMNQVLFRPLFRVLNPQSESMLDLGCGTGQMVRRVSKSVPLRKVVCVDHSEGMLQITKEKFIDKFESISTIRSDLNTFVQDCEDRFDVISCVGVLHHLRRQELHDFLVSVRHLLNPGGSFIVAEPIDNVTLRNPSKWLKIWNAKSAYSGRDYTIHPEDPDESPLDEGELDRLVEEAGFEIEIVRSIVEVFPRSLPPSMIDLLVTKLVSAFYRNSGFIRAIAAKSAN